MSIIQAFQAASGGIFIPPAEVISAVTYLSPSSSLPQWPSGLQDGDIVYFIGLNIDGNPYIPSSLTGWNLEYVFDDGESNTASVYSYESSGTESGSIAVSGGNEIATANVIAMRNVVREPADAGTLYVDELTSTPSVNAASDGSVLVSVFYCFLAEISSWSTPSGMSAFTDNGVLSWDGFYIANSGAYETEIASGATGTRSSTLSGSANVEAGHMTAFVVTPLDGGSSSGGPPDPPGGGISVVGTSNVRGSGTGSSLTSIAYPTGISAGDIIVLLSGNDPIADAYEPSPLTGWTRQLGSFTGSYQVLTRVATGSESGSLSLDNGTTGRPGAAMIVLRGATETPEDADFNEQSSGSLVAPDVTAATAGSIHIVAYFGNLGTTSLSTPTGMTAFSGNTSDDLTMSEAFYELDVVGSTGTTTLPGGATSSGTVTISVVFAPS